MRFYQEITLIDQDEISLDFIWQKLYTQLHLAFVEHKDGQEQISYGVSFPQYRLGEQNENSFLGLKIRIFAYTEQNLVKLNLKKWLNRLTDYVHITSPREVPQQKVTGYAHYSRLQNRQRTMEKRADHQSKRRNIPLQESESYFEKNVVLTPYKPLCEPYIRLKSLSNVQPFSLFIGKTVAERPIEGKFSTYGLSNSSSVPEF